jgi:predicted metalloprotease with PDZ domain
VKRIKPAVFVPYDLSQENYTSLLWLFEGFTSYYDDLMLVRSGLISASEYFSLLGKTLGGVLRGSGRLKQTVAESSFDAWVKYYRQDENAANAIVSYYQKGSLVALAFDLSIRAQTEGKKSLDDVMRLLWQRYGRDFYHGKARGIEENEVEALFAEATGADLKKLFREGVHGTRDLPLETLFEPFGIKFAADVATNGTAAKPSLGARVRNGADCVLAAVHENGAAQKAGLSAGDVLVAIDGLRVTGSNLDTLLSRYLPAAKVEVHAFRRDELRVAQVKLDPPEVSRYVLSTADGGGLSKQCRERWLKG